MQVTNETSPRPEVAQAFFGDADHGPMVMVNLLKFKDKATYPDGRDPELSGRDAYNRYGAAVVACLEKVGGRVIYSGPVSGMLLGQVEEPWDAVALAYYPSPLAMLQMVALPEYQAIEIHRYAGLAGQLNIRTKAQP
ncbi:DUF1330 domain-containing protein [Sandarakinorhabdus oryzae]|uniref:DUF1330 domain-containing protein n=1 Tax=Sandarakinorhabdus oryzae TaxID=2675220 RepID=UPI0012E2EB55|nr:DUF1330 domain-containing protein [Sandarakinorhabdus oryzae]